LTLVTQATFERADDTHYETMTAPPDEGPLLERVRGGEEAAFRTLYRRHTPRLYALVRRLMGARLGETEDVVQEAWLRAVKGLPGFRGESLFSTWLSGIAIRCALESLRRRASSGRTECVEVARAGSKLDLALDLESAVAVLPDGYRTVLILHDIEGRTHAEIAALLEIEEGTSKSQLSRAREAVRARLRSR
jgi:RNA polymerase sigma-70 factor (ECF subfamily)